MGPQCSLLLHLFPRPPPLPRSFFYLFSLLWRLCLPERPFCFPTNFLQLLPPFLSTVLFLWLSIESYFFFIIILGVGRGERTTLMYFSQFSPNLGAEKWQDQCYPPTIQHCTRPAPEPRALKQPVCWRSGKAPGKHPVWGTVPIGNHRCVRIRVLSMCSGSGVSVFLTKRATVEQVMLMWSGNKFLLGFLNWVFASCLFYGFLFYALYL